MPGKKQTRAVKKFSAKQKDVKKSVSNLRDQLRKSEKALTKAKSRAERWRQEATAQKRSASRARARAEKLRQKLNEASTQSKPLQPAVPMDTIPSGRPLVQPTTVELVTLPDETWSVVQLRAEARARGLTGMSNKTKAQLLAALS